MSKGEDFSKPAVRFRKGCSIVFSMLASFRSTPYAILSLKLLSVLLIPVDIIFSVLEKLFRKRRSDPDIPILFVVGVQRTGSTLVSAFIQRTFPFFPIGNFNTLFRHSVFYPHRLFSGFYRKIRTDFSNFYGISRGFFTVGDCYEVWDRWFGRNHYRVPHQLSHQVAGNMIPYFTSLHRAYRRPLLTKNNRNSLLISFFAEHFRNSFFVLVRRDPVAVIRSTLKASRDFFGNDKFLWGLYPDDGFDTDTYENMTEAATVQYLMLEKQIGDQLSRLAPDKYLEVNYEDFCSAPGSFMKDLEDKLVEQFGFDPTMICRFKEPFRPSQRLSEPEIDTRIEYYLEKWKDKL